MNPYDCLYREAHGIIMDHGTNLPPIVLRLDL